MKGQPKSARHRSLLAVLLLLMTLPLGARAADSRDYRVGPEDVIDVRVFDEEELSKEVVVHHSGRINYPLLGVLEVAGLTVDEVEELLRARLAERFLVNPQVFVRMKEYNSRRAVVLGMVKEPGAYSLSGRTSVLDLISRAGGVQDAGGKNLVLIRGGNLPDHPEKDAVPELIDVHRLLRLGESTLNLGVNHGDILFVPRSDGVYVYGEVRKPGSVPYRDGLTVLQAISLSEGLTNKARERRVQVIRGDGDEGQKIQVDLRAAVDEPAQDLRLQPEDIIVVPASFF